MKKIIVTGVVSAIAAVSFAGTASAFTPGTPQCFGQVHKAVNAGAVDGIDNVGQLVQSDLAAGFGNKGQGKNAVAETFC
jgi:hypothetical protein